MNHVRIQSAVAVITADVPGENICDGCALFVENEAGKWKLAVQ